MIPYELLLQNFMCYRGEQTPLSLDGLHIACLSGENGAGKSALLDAITWALWGKARMSDDDLIAQGEREMLVDLTFQLDNHFYRVIRRRQRARSGKRSSGKSTLDFQMRDGAGWRSLSENTLTETDRKIEATLRMNYDTFINASFLLQGRADEFTRKTPGERKQVLADILDLREYALLEERARNRARTLADEIRTIEGAISVLEQDAAKHDLYVQLVGEAEATSTRLAAELATAQQAQQQAAAEVQRLQARSERRSDVQQRLAGLCSEQGQQQHEIDDLRRALAEDEQVLARQTAIREGMAALLAAQQRLTELEALRPRYDALHDERRELKDQLKDELHKLQIDVQQRQSEVERLRQQVERRPQLQADLTSLETRLAALAPQQAELDSVRAAQSSLDERLSRLNALLLRSNELTSRVEQQHKALLAQRAEQQRMIERAQRQLQDMPRWQADLAAAQAQQQQADQLAEQLANLRAQDQAQTEQAGMLRARCEQFKQQADAIKQRQELLVAAETSTCPLCGSDLGEAGSAHLHGSYEQELATLRQHYRESRDAADELDKEIAQLRTQSATLEHQLTQARRGAARSEALQQQLAQAADWQTELTGAQTELTRLEQQLADESYETDARAELQQIAAELGTLTGDLPASQGNGTAAVRQLEEQRKSLAQQRASLEQQLAQRSELESQAVVCRRELATLEAAAEALPAATAHAEALAQTIEASDFAHPIRQRGREIEAELAELGYTPEAQSAARAALHELEHWRDEERRLDIALSRRESQQQSLRRALELLERRAAEIEALQGEERQLTQELAALPAAEQQAAAAARRVAEQQHALEVAQRDLYEKQSLLERARQAAAQLTAQQQQRQTLYERQGIFQELAEACGKKGVQAMLIETAIPEIEHEANRLLQRITGNQMHLTFEMQRSTRKGDIVETLDIKIADALGTRTYDAFSGGEAMRINFAIRIALSRLLAGRAGASLQTLVIDEGMGALDADGRERFVEAITSIQHDFKRILVVTHLEELKERFPARIEITKTPSGSQWMLL